MSGEGRLQDFSVDQAAGSIVLVLGAVSGLLLTIWKSRCECDMNLCYIWRCHRAPPSENVNEINEDEESILPKDKKPKDQKPKADIEVDPPEKELEYVRGGV